MYSKRYLYGIGQKKCNELAEKGYGDAFEEIRNLMRLNVILREQAEENQESQMPNEFQKDEPNLDRIANTLVEAEEATRKGLMDDNYSLRLNIGKYFHHIAGYEWLAYYFYDSCYNNAKAVCPQDTKGMINALEFLILLEEQRGNLPKAMKLIEQANEIAQEKYVDFQDSIIELKQTKSRICLELGSLHLKKEDNLEKYNIQTSKALQYYKNAEKLANMTESLECRAACQLKLGEAVLKFNDVNAASEYYQKNLQLCEQRNDLSGKCDAYYMLSKVYESNGKLDASYDSINKCHDLAKENNFHVPLVNAAIQLGQIKHKQKLYAESCEQFEEAYKTLLQFKDKFPNFRHLETFCRMSIGAAKASLNFGSITELICEGDEALPSLLRWRSAGGLAERLSRETYEDLIEEEIVDLDEPERVDEEARITAMCWALARKELEEE